MLKRLLPVAFAASLLVAPFATAAPAAAQSTGTDAAVGAAVGALVGSLLFDQNRDQYYYYRDSRPVYVSRGWARDYYANRDPRFYHTHRGDFARDGGRFSHDWQYAHGGPGGYGGYGHGHHRGWQR